MIERLKVAWHALTGKEYAFFSIQRHEIGNNGGKCVISNNATELFLGAIIEYTESVLEKRLTNKNVLKQIKKISHEKDI